MASTGGSRDISNKKCKESLFHPRHQRALSWWVTVKALKSTLMAVFTAACEESEPGNGVRCVWGEPPAASPPDTWGRETSFSVWLTDELSSSAIPADVAARELLK